MDHHPHQDNPTPPDCFRLEELEQLQAVEMQALVGVNYYFWINQAEPETALYQFLFFLELIFDDQRSLLLTSGEDSEAIRVSSAEELVRTAEVLRALHGKIVIQRVAAVDLSLWMGVRGKTLRAIRLTKNEQGLYSNDALLLDFTEQKILVRLSTRGGLELGNYEN